MIQPPDHKDWLSVLEESEADLDLGRVVSEETVKRELEAGLSRLQKRASERSARQGIRSRG